jgi:hypothetical protein
MKKSTRDEKRNLSTEFDYKQRKISRWICSDASACAESHSSTPSFFLEIEASAEEI